MKTITKIKSQLVEIIGVDLENIADNSEISSLKIDSLNMLDFHMKLEDVFELNIDIDKFLQCRNLLEIESLVKMYLNNEFK